MEAGLKGCSGCLVVVVILFIVGTLCPHTKTAAERGTMAAIQCRDFVKERLRAPSTADFSALHESASLIGENKYVVRGYVDAQNAFGAQIRNNYACTVQYTGGEDADSGNWRLIDLNISP